MSALADALVAAQRAALTALEKAYVRGSIDADELRELMIGIGQTDPWDQQTLLDSLNVLIRFGAAVPVSEPTNGARPNPETEKATDAQLVLIARLVKEKSQPAPELPLTKAQAHEIIDTLKAGTYDAGRWQVPF